MPDTAHIITKSSLEESMAALDIIRSRDRMSIEANDDITLRGVDRSIQCRGDDARGVINDSNCQIRMLLLEGMDAMTGLVGRHSIG